MDSPKVTVAELLDENRRLRAHHEKELAALKATLRDQFAGQALAGILSDNTEQGTRDQIVKAAWAFADLMLAAREAK